MNARHLIVAGLVAAALSSSCSCGGQDASLALPKKLRIKEIAPERQALLRVSLEVPGLLAPTDLAFTDATHTRVQGSFVLAVDPAKPTHTTVIMRAFGRFSSTSQEVLLGIAKKAVDVEPRASLNLDLAESDWSVSGGAIFDLNQNGADNVDDLVAGFDPAPLDKVLAVLPDAVQFPSGVRPGEFVRQAVVVENVSGLPQQLTPVVVGGQGVSITRIDPTGTPEGGAPRSLAPFTLQPFQEVLLAVTFAPTNEFLVRGSVAIATLQPDSHVAGVSEIGIIANSDGDPQPATPEYDPGTVDGAALGIQAPIIPYPAASLFGGQPIAPGTVQLSNDPADTVTVPALGVGGGALDGIPVDLAFLVEIPAKSRLSVALDGLSADAQLGLFLLDDAGNLSQADGEQLVSANPGTAPESLQFRNTSATSARRAIIALGRVDVREPGDKTVDKGVPFALLAQLDSGPEFSDENPLSRTHGDFRGGNDLTLSGVDFEQGATVLIGGHLATPTSVSDDGTTITTVTPAATSDDLGSALTVVAINPDGEAATLPAVFTYDPPAPEIDEIDPNTGSTLGGTSILITGAFFSGAHGGPNVKVGAQLATDVTLVSSNQLTATVPAQAAGFTTVVVENIGDGGALIDSAGFPFVYVEPAGEAPAIASIDPSTGATDGGELVTIQGAGFATGASVRFGGSVPSEVTIAADGSSITCRTPPKSAPGAVDVLVTNPDGQTTVAPNAFTYVNLPPTLIDASPTSISTLGGTRVFVDGADLKSGATATFGQGTTSVASPSVTFVNDTRLIVTAPGGLTAGAASLVVTNPDGQASPPLPLTVTAPAAPPPSILSLNPSTVRVDALGTVQVTGTGFQPGMLAFIDAAALPVAGLTSTSFSFTAPQHAVGAAIVRVVNPDGQTDASALVYEDALVPVFTSVSPDAVGALVPGDVVTVAGQNLVTIDDAHVHLLDGTGAEHGATLVSFTGTTLKVRIDDPLPERGDYVVRADFSTGSATSPAFAAIAPALLSQQALAPPVDGADFTVLLQGSALNHARITTARFVRSGDALTVDIAPTFATDSLVRIDSGGRITQGTWNIFLVYAYTDAAGTPGELDVSVPDPSGGAGASAPFVVSGQCGNGALDAGEECDGTIFSAGLSCTGFGFFGGSLQCDQNCHVRTTQCTNCGNGLIDAAEFEECDGTNFAGKTCGDLVPGSVGGLACNAQCQINANGCSICGNGVIEGDEECDGNNFGGATCSTLGFNSGQIECDPITCRLDGGQCTTCGNNRCDALENSSNCAQDCPASCGDGTCNNGETCQTCPKDCGGQCTSPFSIAVASGDGQQRTFSRDLVAPVVVHVSDAAGSPLVGLQVTFAQQGAASTGAKLSPTTALTDASGNAATLLTLGRTLGVQSFTVTGTGPDNQLLAGAPLTFTATALDLSPLQIVTLANQQAVAGRTSLLDGNGNQRLLAASKVQLSLDGNGESGVAVRADGAVFVADTNNHRVVRIDPDGTMVHVAGSNTGQAGFAGDGGPAKSALLFGPRGVALDGNGNLYIADNGNARVRKIDAATGAISTFAGVGPSNPNLPNDGDGGLATSAFLSGATEIAVNPLTNDVFVSCDGSNSIRKIDASTGFISTVAASSACSSGTGLRPGDINIGGLAFDRQGRLVFHANVSDFGGCPASGDSILRLESDGTFSLVGGGGQADGENIQARGAHLVGVSGVAVDSGGNTYVSERPSGSIGRRVRKISNIGLISTIVDTTSTQGSGGDGGAAASAQLNVPGQLAFATNGDLLLTDGANHDVRLVRSVADSTPPSFQVTPVGDNQNVAVGAGLAQSIGIQVNSGATPIPGVLVHVTPPAGGAVEPSTVLTDGSGRAAVLAFAPRTLGSATYTVTAVGFDGNPLPTTDIHANVVDVAQNTIFSIANQRGTNGSTLSSAATRSLLSLTSGNMGLCADPTDGSFIVADHNNNRVLRVAPSGAISVVAGTGTGGNSGDGGLATGATLRSPRGCAVDAGGNVYISDAGNAEIRVVTAADGKIDRFAGGGSASANNGDGGDATQANLNNPGALAIAPVALDGQGAPTADSQALYIVDENHNVVRKVVQRNPASPGVSGAISTPIPSAVCTSGGGFHMSSFGFPSGLAFDKEGRLYVSGNVADFGGCVLPGGAAVARLESDGTTLTPIAGGATARASGPALGTQLSGPTGLAVDPAGNLYVAERNAHVLRVIDVLGRIRTIAGVSGATGFTGEYGDAGGAKLNGPTQIAFDASGNLAVLDEQNQAVRLIRALASSTPDTATMTIAAGNAQNVTIGQQASLPLRVHVVDGAGDPIAGLVVTWAALDPGDTALQRSSVTSTSGDATTTVRLGFDASASQQHRFQAVVRTALDPTDIGGSPALFSLTAARPPSTNMVAFLNIAGLSGAGGLPQPSTELRANLDFSGIAQAADGTMYVADTFNHRVLQISTEGEVSLFAGTGTAGFNDNTPAVLGQLNAPRGLAVDDLGNVYIVDTSNNRIRVVTLDGNITTYAGGAVDPAPLGDGGSATPGANIQDARNIAFDPVTTDLLVVDQRHAEIRRIARNDPALIGDEQIFALASSGLGNVGTCTSASGLRPTSFSSEHTITVDAAGNIYFSANISDFGGCPVPSGEYILKLAEPAATYSVVVGAGPNTATGDGPVASSQSLSGAFVTGLAILPGGDLVFAEHDHHRIRRVAGAVGSGALTTIAGTFNNTGFATLCTGTACLLSQPSLLLADPTTGDLYVSETANKSVRLMIAP